MNTCKYCGHTGTPGDQVRITFDSNINVLYKVCNDLTACNRRMTDNQIKKNKEEKGRRK